MEKIRDTQSRSGRERRGTELITEALQPTQSGRRPVRVLRQARDREYELSHSQ